MTRALRVALLFVMLESGCSEAAPPQPSPSPATVASASPTPFSTTSPAKGFENAILGYRITLPTGYRRSLARIVTGEDSLGFDYYTTVTEAKAREACTKDIGHLGAPSGDDQSPSVRIEVSRNARGLSAMEWATTPGIPGGFVASTHMKVEPRTVGGREAVRLIEDNASASTTGFVIRANDRIYEIRLDRWPSQPKTWLDDVVMSFVTITPVAFPSPTATVAPAVATAELGAALASAFAAKNVDAIARLMPECSIASIHIVDGLLLGQGGINRSVALFTQGLRERFAAGALIVAVYPVVQFGPRNGGEYFVRSEWSEPDRTTRIDLIFGENDGRWLWTLAAHYYTTAQMSHGCLPYRSPWVDSQC